VEERLQKILARTGLGSRRKCEELISSGRVRVNGQVASLGSKADPEHDRILLDGQLLVSAQEFVYIAVYKPRGVVSTTAEELGRPTVLDLVPFTHRLYPVGRLDMDSEGLVLLTNDGQLANRLTHPRFGHEKEYRVLVARHPDSQQLEAWKHGVVLEDGFRTAPAAVRIESNQGKGSWLRVILREGRKRQIREMGALTGLPVVRIIRIRIGALSLGSLKPKEWRYLDPAEINALKTPAVREKSTGRNSRPAAQKTAGKQTRKYPTPHQ
jgi:23S rRNA pseudouridine2605 synthase